MFDKLSLLIRIILGPVIIKVLFLPGIRKWFDRVVCLYERELIKNERDLFGQKQAVSRLNFQHYLPDTAARIERLRRLINKRAVAIILHGPSLIELEARITELEDCDICYFGLNSFMIPEEHILQKINRTYSVVLTGGIPRKGAPVDIADVADHFLERQEDNMFICESDSVRPLQMTHGISPDEFIKKYDEKLLFYTGVPTTRIMVGGDGLYLPVPSVQYPLHFLRLNAFSFLLVTALICEASLVVIFGADGGRINAPELYYSGTDVGVSELVLEESLVNDTRLFNLTMPLILEKIYKIYDLRPVDIINCSLQSNYTPLRKLSYDDTFALLKSFTKGYA